MLQQQSAKKACGLQSGVLHCGHSLHLVRVLLQQAVDGWHGSDLRPRCTQIKASLPHVTVQKTAGWCPPSLGFCREGKMLGSPGLRSLRVTGCCGFSAA
jgi:hypothetical protein